MIVLNWLGNVNISVVIRQNKNTRNGNLEKWEESKLIINACTTWVIIAEHINLHKHKQKGESKKNTNKKEKVHRQCIIWT